MMILLIFLVVAIYTMLLVWILAKVGSVPAQSVIQLMTSTPKKSINSKKKLYEESATAK
ncbi:hypothetical protein [Halobacillus seohaensis]|uniref:Uncharacterized protein n=1 Tax=Halobacillus seohaensis TaxID=447421 RepID=A0ABW2EHM7_9BACI